MRDAYKFLKLPEARHLRPAVRPSLRARIVNGTAVPRDGIDMLLFGAPSKKGEARA